MIVIDAVTDWLQQNAAGVIVGLLLWVIFLGTIAYHVKQQNNLPRK
jgi:predicted negative regulator of RcsB-dependent stress response